MNITLPQTEDRWGAPTAQAWASFPSPTGLSTLPLIGRASINLLSASRTPQSLEQVTAERNWETSWTKTGTLGKQAIVQLLLNSILTERNHPRALLSSIQFHWGPDINLECPVLEDTVGTRNPNREVSVIGYQSPLCISTSLHTNLPSGPSEDIGFSYNPTPPLPKLVESR